MKVSNIIRLAIIVVLCSTLLAGCGSETDNNDSNSSFDGSYQSGYQMSEITEGDTVVTIKTSMGDIKIKLFPEKAPKAVENFVTHAKNGYYNNVIFHRVINDFMIQGGDPEGTGYGGESIWGKPFEDEFSNELRHFRGALSMANAGPNTNGSQFFIVQNKNIYEPYIQIMEQYDFPEDIIENYKQGGVPELDGQHTVFGQVFEGMDIVDKIAEVEVDDKAKPLEDVVILSIEVQEGN
ncbi:MAG: peptidylprolyl isomerase [Clostridiaceae bacterium]|jgi:peptidyl-prolyl cis-trans isomerase B (cyclophilin B)|nr:peptidylprolyl isomerase [Clostridiaceae bacterium]